MTFLVPIANFGTMVPYGTRVPLVHTRIWYGIPLVPVGIISRVLFFVFGLRETGSVIGPPLMAISNFDMQ